MRVLVAILGALLAVGSMARASENVWRIVEEELRYRKSKGEISASTALRYCERNNDLASLGRCYAWVMPLPEHIIGFGWRCAPGGTMNDFEQLRRLFVREGQRVPEALHLPVNKFLEYTMAKAYPCR